MSQLLSGKVRVTRPQDVSDGRYEYLSLQEAEPNLGIPSSGSIQSGSVALIASDIDGNRLFITKIQLEEFSGSFSGSFEGDGSKLNNLPFSSQLISGSASASISPNTGFLVNVSSSFDGDMDIDGDVRVTGDLYVDNRIVAREIIVEIISSSIIFSSGSNRFGNTTGDLQEFTGSVDITGSLEVEGNTTISEDLSVSGSIFTTNVTSSVVSSSFFIGDGSQLFNLPAAEQSSRIVDGDVVALVDENVGFVVTSIDSGSQISGSLFISGNIEINSGSSFSGSGANLFNIPKAALTPDALLSSFIVSGSVTASVDPNIGFRLEGTDRAEFSSSLFVSGGVSVISGSTFSGSGENLFDIPFSALSTDAQQSITSLVSDESKILVSGSVTASVDAENGFIVTSIASGSTFFGDIQLQTGSFSGSGEKLRDIPLSALTIAAQEAIGSSLIASASVTASVSPNGGFIVTSIDSGSTFFGEVRVESGSAFSGSGEKLRDIPFSALSTDAQQSIEALVSDESKILVSGSVTASVDAENGFIVTSIESGSTFFGDVKLSSGSVFSGSGADLFNIPKAALTPDALLSNLIVSGAITASVTPEEGFIVTSVESGSTFFGEVRVESGSAFSGSGEKLRDIPFSALSTDAQDSITSLVSDESKILVSGSVSASVDAENGFIVTSIASGSTFFGNVGVASGSSFSGSGALLNDIPFAAISITSDDTFSSIISGDSKRLVTGSVTASVSNEDGFKVESIESGSTFFGDVKVQTGDVKVQSGSFSGSGAQLFDIPRSALTEDALLSTLIASGSVTASTDDNVFKVTSIDNGSIFSGSIQVDNAVTASGFKGSGRDLTDVVVTEMVSASVRADVSPDDGFRVLSQIVGSQFTGSVSVDTSIQAGTFVSASTFKGSGAELTDIISTEIVSGAVTATVAPNEGFVVTSTDSGSTFIGSIDVDGIVTLGDGSFFSGSGEGLFDIPRSALTEDALLTTEIVSGSVTASVSPNGFIVTSIDSGSTFSGSSKHKWFCIIITI